jgi:hypothetical protein
MFTEKKLIQFLPAFAVLTAYLTVISSHQHVDPDAKVILENLYSAGSISGYLKNLFTLQTIDFQPLRDLTLSFDIWAFYRLNTNTFVIQNVLWWIGTLYLLSAIVSKLFHSIPEITRTLLISCLGVYPLYSPVISWGMNRKHLIALFFITLGTLQLMKAGRKTLPVICCYLLSLLAQPIHLLWPAWAAFFLFQEKRLKENLRLFIGLTVVFIGLVTINSIYYTTSSAYKFHYTDKTADIWNIPDKVLALGHYLFQLLFPYLLSFKYELSHWSVLTGIVILPVLAIVIYRKKNSRIISWCLLGFLPLLMVLNDPHVISDAYLLLPGIATFLLILEVVRLKASRYWLIIPLFAWTALTSWYSSRWNDRLTLARSGFENRPSCESVVNYMKVGYDLYVRSPEALRFTEANSCLKDMTVTGSFYYSMVVFFAHYYFHESELPLDFRLERLRQMKDKHLYAHLSLVGLLIKENRRIEARSEMEGLVEKWKRIRISEEYHEITVRYVKPFCEEEKIPGCQDVIKNLIRKPVRPNL